MSQDHPQEYDDGMVALLEAVWGEGYMSPGGADEIRKIVDRVEFAGKTVLDIGCGTGGIAQFLVMTFNPRRIIGIDVDPGLVETATDRARHAGLDSQLEFRCVDPGPLPFDDASFDIVFSKDAMIHIADKEALFEEIFRVLKPGGTVSAGDWMSSTDGPFSPQMKAYIDLENLGFGMGSPARYRKAMQLAGFEDIDLTDRNAWYKTVVAKEYEALSGPLYGQLVASLDREFVDHSIEIWRALKIVVDRGELRPTHIRARKPVN